MAEILDFSDFLDRFEAVERPSDTEAPAPIEAETVAQRRLVDILDWLAAEAKAGRLVWTPGVALEDENG